MLLDMLKRPIKVGDNVLAKGYLTTNYQQYVVKKVARVNIYINVTKSYWSYDSSARKWAIIKEDDYTIARKPNDVIVVNEQLEYNKTNWPENYI